MTAMPNADPARRILAILTVRNEGAFVVDWLAHHRACGFTDFLVISNDCTDGTDLMLDRLQALGQLTHLRNDGPHPRGPQWAALKRAEAHPLRAAADWIMVFDIDEFVNIHVGDHTIAALLAALPDATAIPLSWRLFGNGGTYAQADKPVSETFTLAAPADLRWPWRAALFKTLFRNDGSYGRLGVHRPRRPDPGRIGAQRWFDGSGRPLPPAYHTGRVFLPPGTDRFGLAQLNHYALGSVQDYILKCDRGRANRAASAFDMAYWVERNFCTLADTSILALSGPVAAARAALLADARLAALHRGARDWRQQRFATLMQDESYRDLLVRILVTPPSRVLQPAEVAVVEQIVRQAQTTKPEIATKTD